jgi:voltage-gated potassium channel
MVPGNQSELGKPPQRWRRRMHEVIFESETPAGRFFDKVIVTAILVSVGVVILDSVAAVNREHRPLLNAMEWFFTLLFTGAS